jgi:hypothetical protein
MIGIKLVSSLGILSVWLGIVLIVASDPHTIQPARELPRLAKVSAQSFSGLDRHRIVVSIKTCEEKFIAGATNVAVPYNQCPTDPDDPLYCIRCDAPGTNVEFYAPSVSGQSPPGYYENGLVSCGTYYQGICGFVGGQPACTNVQQAPFNCLDIVEVFVQSPEP